MSLFRMGYATGLAGFTCMMRYCTPEVLKCYTESVCRDTLGCVQHAKVTQPGSLLNCEVEEAMKGDINDFTFLTDCMYNHKCQP